MAGERNSREADFMNKSLDEIAAEMDSSLYDREAHRRQQRPRFSPYPDPGDHVPSWRAERGKESGGGAGGGRASKNGGDQETAKVFAANLSFAVTWQKLKDHMKKGIIVISYMYM